MCLRATGSLIWYCMQVPPRQSLQLHYENYYNREMTHTTIYLD